MSQQIVITFESETTLSIDIPPGMDTHYLLWAATQLLLRHAVSEMRNGKNEHTLKKQYRDTGDAAIVWAKSVIDDNREVDNG
jgi:hypothetical protein